MSTTKINGGVKVKGIILCKEFALENLKWKLSIREIEKFSKNHFKLTQTITFQVGGSLYASNMGSEHFVGLAGSGAASGIGVVAYEWHASWILLLLGFFFVPIYIRSKIYTMPEYLMNRFQSKWMRFYLTVVSLISYVTTKIAVRLNLFYFVCLIV